MANIVQHPVDFHLRNLSHAPSPLGFGFGLGSSLPSGMGGTGWQFQSTPSPGHINPPGYYHVASSVNSFSPLRVQKRRHEADDESDLGDRSMDRSPTPERPKHAAPKRARVAPTLDSAIKNDKGNKASANVVEHHDVDVGMLLASLPSQSLLPLLHSLLTAQPSLKSTILSLIPRPSLETAIQALAQSSKKLREAYPYSNNGPISSSQSVASTTFGFGKASLFQNQSGNNNGMRDSYVISRLKPHIADFESTCFSYLPYFSSAPNPPERTPADQPSLRDREKSHPSETFLFLAAVTRHVISHPPLTQLSLGRLLLPRLCEEWNGWIQRVDETVNHQGGMFGSETVESWIRGLDEMAGSKMGEEGNMMGAVRDLWVSKVGWMVGRQIYK